MVGWTNGRMNTWMAEESNQQRYWRKDEWTDRRTQGRTNQEMNRPTNVRTYGRMVGQKVGAGTDRRMNGSLSKLYIQL